ncbi:MAG: hypothetical protein ACRC80_31475, partial [Waterburya sp.]
MSVDNLQVSVEIINEIFQWYLTLTFLQENTIPGFIDLSGFETELADSSESLRLRIYPETSISNILNISFGIDFWENVCLRDVLSAVTGGSSLGEVLHQL